jgi:hypothetical protein
MLADVVGHGEGKPDRHPTHATLDRIARLFAGDPLLLKLVSPYEMETLVFDHSNEEGGLARTVDEYVETLRPYWKRVSGTRHQAPPPEPPICFWTAR